MPTHPATALAADVEDASARAREERDALGRSLEHLRAVRRDLAEAARAVEAAVRDADRRTIRSHKETLRATWRSAMEDAPDEAARQAATTVWLRHITDANRRMGRALRQLSTGRERVLQLEAQLRAADLDAASARIRAEVAEAACADARRHRAEAEEAVVRLDGRDRAGIVAAAGLDIAVVAMTRDALAPDSLEAVHETPVGGAAAGSGEEAGGPSVEVAAVESATVRRLLADDPGTHAAIAGELAEMSGQLPARYLLLLRTLVDELCAAAIDAGELVFDHDHPLWCRFSPEEARLVLRGLRDLGFRLDLDDGWFGERAPRGVDLAAALAFAGHDARALRGMPSSDQLRDLPSSIHVAVHDHLRHQAPDLSLPQMTRALGSRAPLLGELWDEWGRVRPLLLSGVPGPGAELLTASSSSTQA